MRDFLEKEVLALPPGEAAEVLERAGFKVQRELTGPPRGMPCGDAQDVRERVLRLRFRGDTAVLTVAREPGNGKGIKTGDQ